ncbi:MAG TPA: hypothetical protein VMA32_14240 [Streptosporangiaceae bacterium]|nr:hypothetical protein [Streptosporangiaceae bacterium]
MAAETTDVEPPEPEAAELEDEAGAELDPEPVEPVEPDDEPPDPPQPARTRPAAIATAAAAPAGRSVCE